MRGVRVCAVLISLLLGNLFIACDKEDVDVSSHPEKAILGKWQILLKEDWERYNGQYDHGLFDKREDKEYLEFRADGTGHCWYTKWDVREYNRIFKECEFTYSIIGALIIIDSVDTEKNWDCWLQEKKLAISIESSTNHLLLEQGSELSSYHAIYTCEKVK